MQTEKRELPAPLPVEGGRPGGAAPENPSDAKAEEVEGAMPPPPRLPPPGAFRTAPAMANILDSPILLPMATHVEPSPSTSLMSYPLPLFHPGGGRMARPPAVEDPSGKGFFPPWSYPRNFIAPSRNRQAAARAAVRPPTEKEKPKREGAANEDGYNWRKYGEKTVKGSPYPRSYYKCSHPGCTVKKIIERDPRSGRVSQAVPKGVHNHAKPGQVRGGGGSALRDRGSESPQPPGPLAATRPGSRLASSDGGRSERGGGGGDQRDSAAAALQLLGTGFSPLPPALVGGGPLLQSPSAHSLLPIPASLRTSAEQRREVNLAARRPRRGGGGGGRRGGRASGSDEDTEPSSGGEEYESEDDSESGGEGGGEDWDAPADHFRSEPASVAEVASAAAAAARAAAAAAAEAARRQSEAEAAAPPEDVVLGKRRRGRQQRFGESDKEELSTDDEELQALRNLSRGSRGTRRQQQRHDYSPGGEGLGAEEEEEDDGEGRKLPAKRRRPPPAPAAAAVESGARRASEAGAGDEGDGERSVVEVETEAETVDDGYRWRKYGQKTVKGNPYPRSYYKCTHPGCGVRKQVERSGRNAAMLLMTYEGAHSHSPPAQQSARAGARRASLPGAKREYSEAVSPIPAAFGGGAGMPSLQQALAQMVAGGNVPVIVAQPGSVTLSAGGAVQLTMPTGMPGAQAGSVAAALAASQALAAAARTHVQMLTDQMKHQADSQHWQQAQAQQAQQSLQQAQQQHRQLQQQSLQHQLHQYQQQAFALAAVGAHRSPHLSPPLAAMAALSPPRALQPVAPVVASPAAPAPMAAAPVPAAVGALPLPALRPTPTVPASGI